MGLNKHFQIVILTYYENIFLKCINCYILIFYKHPHTYYIGITYYKNCIIEIGVKLRGLIHIMETYAYKSFQNIFKPSQYFK